MFPLSFSIVPVSDTITKTVIDFAVVIVIDIVTVLSFYHVIIFITRTLFVIIIVINRDGYWTTEILL